MDPAGELRIELRLRARAGRCEVAAASLRVERPRIAQRLVGLRPEQGIELVGTIHAVCAAAHRWAAQQAVEAARGRRPGRATRIAAGRAIRAEALREHARHLFLEWPRVLGAAPTRELAAACWRIAGLPPGESRRLQAAGIRPAFDEACAGLRRALRERLAVLLGNAGPARTEVQIEARLAARIEAARLALSRQAAVARLREAQEPAEVSEAAVPVPYAANAMRHGAGAATTARGRLEHRASLAPGTDGIERIAAYEIDAPTDRHFAPDAGVADALQSLRAPDAAALLAAAGCLVLSHDPCVAWRIETAAEAA